MTGLLSCPLCGGKVDSDCFARNAEGLCTEPAVCCDTCGYIMTFDFVTANPHADVIAKFNTRTDPPVAMDDRIQSLIADNERLREDVQAIREALDWAANFDPVLVDKIRERALSHKDMSRG